MSHLHASENLLLTHQEVARLDQFAQTEGIELSRQLLTGSPGLIINTGTEWLATVDNPVEGTIQLSAGQAIDNSGRLLRQGAQRGIVLPQPDTWYWLMASYATSSLEDGLLTIGENGQLTGDGAARFTQVLRGLPGAPTLLRLTKADGSACLNGGIDHEVQQVLDDQHAVLSTVGLVAETGLRYQVVGAFLSGWEPHVLDEMIYRYDSCQLELLAEVVAPYPPAYSAGHNGENTYLLARVRRTSAGVDIEDKRGRRWLTRAETELGSHRVAQTGNPLLGLERVYWPLAGTPRSHSIAVVGFGLRAQAWSFDAAQRQLTLTQGAGGRYRSLNDAQAGDFVGWYVTRDLKLDYNAGGAEPRWRITASSKPTGSSLRLQLEGADPFALTETWRNLLLVPDCEQVHFKVVPSQDWDAQYGPKFHAFPAHHGSAEIELPCGGQPVNYFVEACTAVGKERTTWRPLDLAPFYPENQHDGAGKLLPTAVLDTDTGDRGTIRVRPAPDGYRGLLDRVDLGDVPGVEHRQLSTAEQALPIRVGNHRQLQIINAGIGFTQHQYLDLRPDRAGITGEGAPLLEGNEFSLWINGDVQPGAYDFKIVVGYKNPADVGQVCHSFDERDFYAMRTGGIYVSCTYGDGGWQVLPHRRVELPIATVLQLNRLGNYNPLTRFGADGKGTREWADYVLMDGRNGTDNMGGMVALGYQADSPATPTDSLGERTELGVVSNYGALGNVGGNNDVQLSIDELPAHDHTMAEAGDHSHTQVPNADSTGAGNDNLRNATRGGQIGADNRLPNTSTAPAHVHEIDATGGGQYHENRQRYRVLAYVQRYR